MNALYNEKVEALPKAKWLMNKFKYFVSEYESAGWQGGLNWYASLDLNWELTPELAGQRLRQPIAFIAGSEDAVMGFYGGQDKVEALIDRTGEQCDFVRIIEGAGHWIQQERPETVNALLLSFVGDHKALFSSSSEVSPAPPPPPPPPLPTAKL